MSKVTIEIDAVLEPAVRDFLAYKPTALEMDDDDVPSGASWCFHTGQFRSGTTGLVNLCDAHPDVTIISEMYLWRYTEILSRGVFRTNPHTHGIQNCYAMQRMNIRRWPASRVRAFFEGLRQMVAPRAQVFGDKAMTYIEHLEEVRTVFPDCKLIHITRNKWDIAASMVAASWWRESPNVAAENPNRESTQYVESALRRIEAWEQNPAVRRILADPEAENAFVVSFERLAEAPREAVGEMLDFLCVAQADYDWSALDRVHYADAIDHWRRIPEVVKVRNEYGE